MIDPIITRVMAWLLMIAIVVILYLTAHIIIERAYQRLRDDPARRRDAWK